MLLLDIERRRALSDSDRRHGEVEPSVGVEVVMVAAFEFDCLRESGRRVLVVTSVEILHIHISTELNALEGERDRATVEATAL